MSHYPPPGGPYRRPAPRPAVDQAARQRLRQRIGDAERTAATDQLSSHFSAGRLTQDEFDERLTAVMNARNTGDLWRQLSDLPALPNQPRVTVPVIKPRTPGISHRTFVISALALCAGFGVIMSVAMATFSSPFVIFCIGLAVVGSGFLGYGLGMVQRWRGDRKIIEDAQRRRELGR